MQLLDASWKGLASVEKVTSEVSKKVLGRPGTGIADMTFLRYPESSVSYCCDVPAWGSEALWVTSRSQTC